MVDCPCPHHPFGCFGHPTTCKCAKRPTTMNKGLLRLCELALIVAMNDDATKAEKKELAKLARKEKDSALRGQRIIDAAQRHT